MVLSDHTVRIWETGTRREIMRLTDNPIGTRLLAISPDNRILAQGVGSSQGWGHGTDQTLILRDISLAQNESLAETKQPGGRYPSYDQIKKRFRVIAGHLGSVTCMAFSPDSKYLATGGSDQVIYIWPVKDFITRAELPESTEEIATLWERLAEPAGGDAYKAIAQLERRPKETLAFVRQHLKPAPTAEQKAIRQHVRDLSAANYSVRQQAYVALEKLGEQAKSHLQLELKTQPNLEVKRRVESLLEKLERPFDDAAQLRAYRALTVLERIGGADARTLLEELARGAASAWLTQEARHSLDRLRVAN
jgi:hypothetical protein